MSNRVIMGEISRNPGGPGAIAAPGPLLISCFIITKNEEKRIARAINSVIGLVDEIVVVDSGSTDRTTEICRELGARIIVNDWKGYGPQKRFAEAQCRNDWLLNLDADEVLTGALANEIRNIFAPDRKLADGYRLVIAEMFPGRNRPLPLARHDQVIRLYDRRKMRFSDSPVHDRVFSGEARVKQMKNVILHYSFLTLSQSIAKINYYTDLQAATNNRHSPAVLRLRLLTELPLNFIRYYLFRGYFMAGFQGLSYAMVHATFRFFRIAKMLEMKKSGKSV